MKDHNDVDQGERALLDALAGGLTEVLRVVHFSRAEEWLEELGKQRHALALPFVRATAVFRYDQAISFIQHVSLAAGFWGAGEFVELKTYCGQRAAEDDGDAIRRYERDLAKIKTACAAWGLEVRSGQWTPHGAGR